MNLKKMISIMLFFSLLWSASAFSTPTKDCLASYKEGTGILEIPCLEYSDKIGHTKKEILSISLKKINLSNSSYIFELRDGNNSLIQNDDFIPTY